MNEQQLPFDKDLKESTRFMGRELERVVAAANQYYDAKKIASVNQIPRWWFNSNQWEYTNYKNPEVVARTRGGHFIKAGASMVDFGGTVKRRTSDGRFIGHSVYFDAKSTKETSLGLDNIDERQITFVTRKQMFGARAGFIVWFRKYDRYFFITAAYVFQVQTDALVRRGRKSISPAMCETHGQEIFFNIDRILDWVPALFPTEENLNAKRETAGNEKHDQVPAKESDAGN